MRTSFQHSSRLLRAALDSVRRRVLVRLVCMAGVCGCLPGAVADDWPQFLGPNANGTSAETGLREAWLPSGPPMLWEKAVGTGYSAPSIRGDRLVLHHRAGNSEVIEAFHPASGRALWRHAYPSQFVDPYGYNNGPRASPLLTTNRCYALGAEGRLVCLDIENGTPVWEIDTHKRWNIPEAFFGVGSSPILEGDLLIVMIGGQPNSGVAAFKAATGEVIWESVGAKNWQGVPMVGWPGERDVVWQNSWKQASYATPVAATVNGQRQIFCLMRQGLVSLDPASGAVNFSYWFQARVNESVNAANPVVSGDKVFISGAYYRVGSVLLRVAPDNASVEPVWRDTVLEIHWTTPLLRDGYLYAFSGRNEPDARFRCVELETGKLMWDRDESWRRSSNPPDRYGRGSAILADGKLIVLGESGLLGMFKPEPSQPVEICRSQIPQLSYPCWTAPVLANKRLYLRSEDRLLCFDFVR